MSSPSPILRELAPEHRSELAQLDLGEPTELLARLRADQRHRWARGHRIGVECYRSLVTGLANDPQTLEDLIYSEYLLRRELGEMPTREEYRDRLPEHVEALERQLEFEVWVGEPMFPFPEIDTPQNIPSASIKHLGPFQIVRKLGEGNMGVVFEAEEPPLGRKVAVKVMRPELKKYPSAPGRFLREARAMAALEHPRIVPIYRVGDENGDPYLAMPLLKGETLKRRLERDGALPILEALRLGREIAEGLAVAHAAQLIHRDVKPANIWLKPDAEGVPHVLILDFGLVCDCPHAIHELEHGSEASSEDDALTASARQGEGVVGTASYMAPEQALGHSVDPRTDLFSLGCVLYEMCTGVRPFEGPTFWTTIARVIEHHPPDVRKHHPEIPAAVAELIAGLMKKPITARPESAREVATELARLERENREPSTPLTEPRRPGWMRVEVPTKDGHKYLYLGWEETACESIPVSRWDDPEWIVPEEWNFDANDFLDDSSGRNPRVIVRQDDRVLQITLQLRQEK